MFNRLKKRKEKRQKREERPEIIIEPFNYKLPTIPFKSEVVPQIICDKPLNSTTLFLYHLKSLADQYSRVQEDPTFTGSSKTYMLDLLEKRMAELKSTILKFNEHLLGDNPKPQ
jgi:hypothetical protein